MHEQREGRLRADPLDEADADATKRVGGAPSRNRRAYRLLSVASLPTGVRRAYWLSFRVTCLDSRVKYIHGHLHRGNYTSGYVSRIQKLATRSSVDLSSALEF